MVVVEGSVMHTFICFQVAFMSVMGLWSRTASLKVDDADVVILKALTEAGSFFSSSNSSSSSSSSSSNDMLPLFYRIIMRNKQTLQKAALKCITIFNIPGISLHISRINRLIDDETFKNETVVFATGLFFTAFSIFTQPQARNFCSRVLERRHC
jgi:hypothetical protein